MIDLTLCICTLKKDFVYKSKYPVIIVSPYGCYSSEVLYVQDYKQGMGKARNLGLDDCDSDYILYMSDDNLIHDNVIEKTVKEMNKNKWVGIAFRQKIPTANTYLEKCINIRNNCRFTPGEKQVIGTPFIWETDILKKYRFDDNMKYSDDTDLAERLRKDGYKFGYSYYIACEGRENAKLKNIYSRFKNYGISDRDYYRKYSKNWTLKRKMQSLLHPLKAEWIYNVYYLPFYLLCVTIRYKGFLS